MEHILRRWDSLAERTVFLQAEPDHVERARLDETVLRALRSAADFSPIGNFRIDCLPDGAPHHPGLPIGRVWQGLFGSECPTVVRGHAGGQFVVSRAAICRRSREFYERCNALLSTGVDPIEGYVFERLWSYVFGVEPVRSALAAE